jgi:hypothetical protein
MLTTPSLLLAASINEVRSWPKEVKTAAVTALGLLLAWGVAHPVEATWDRFVAVEDMARSNVVTINSVTDNQRRLWDRQDKIDETLDELKNKLSGMQAQMEVNAAVLGRIEQRLNQDRRPAGKE